MVTLWIQTAFGEFMSKAVAPAAIRAAARVVPAEHMPTVQEVVEKLLNPNLARIATGNAASGMASEVRP